MNAIVPITTAEAITASDLTNSDPNGYINAFGWLQRWRGARFTTYESATNYLQQRSSKTEGRIVPAKSIKLESHPDPRPSTDDSNMLLVSVDGAPARGMTHWAFGQLAQLAKAPADYLRSLPAPIVEAAVEHGLRHNREAGNVQAYAGSNVVAFTGERYGRVFDFAVLDATRRAIDTGRWAPAERHMGISATDRSLQIFLVEQSDGVEIGTIRGRADVVRRGIRISNSEVGGGALKVDAFLFRDYCLNGCIFGLQNSESISVRHSSGAPERWIREVQPVIHSYLEGDKHDLAARIEKAREAQVARDEEAAVEWLRSKMGSLKRAKRALELHETEEGRPARTGWDMIMAITATAREQGSVEERVELEQIGGKVLDLVAA